MCLIAIAWHAHPELPLVVAANRDEWHERPAAPAHWWADTPQVLAGRDLQAGGTWLGVSRSGRFAALTNFRDPSDRKPGAPTRGRLVSDFLQGAESPRQYLERLPPAAATFQGFNLLVGDRDLLLCFASRTGEVSVVTPGVHALSNHTLDEPWPKVQKAKSALEAALGAEVPEEARQSLIYELLSSTEPAPDAVLPDTGVGIEWERRLSPAMIVGEKYGTRCSTMVSLANTGSWRFCEWTRSPAGEVTQKVELSFSSAA